MARNVKLHALYVIYLAMMELGLNDDMLLRGGP